MSRDWLGWKEIAFVAAVVVVSLVGWFFCDANGQRWIVSGMLAVYAGILVHHVRHYRAVGARTVQWALIISAVAAIAIAGGFVALAMGYIATDPGAYLVRPAIPFLVLPQIATLHLHAKWRNGMAKSIMERLERNGGGV